jgi:hypothetical protein
MQATKFLLPGLLAFIASHLYSQSMSFEISLFGKKVGEMTVKKQVSTGGIVNYTIKSTTTATILFKKIEAITDHSATYKNGILINSYHQHQENGEIKSFCRVNWNGSEYQIHRDEGKFTQKEAADFSIVTIFFEEPVGRKKIFYEAEGEYDDLKNSSPGVYEYKSSDGHRNIYIFKNGQISEAEFHVSIATVKMKRIT